ncbi:uncharacterized protein LOC123904879 [Trifolium pratense]|uniref:Uncharacterized protein n=1 Tax=Trifolium pratense TaxID=57577 RepID=A0ACB0LCB4_TRIPR|nr:uncharacterized protein LOC123904879 [Trifolium pratense]CAJ2666975.1 unnamed protein product [Trifolium pratense]
MGLDDNAWCAYHRCRGHSTEKCFRLRDLIEELIKSGHLRKFIDDAAQGRVVVPKAPRQEPRDPPGPNREPPKGRISVNTIAGGFSGGGESSSARKRYVRRAISEIYLVSQPQPLDVPDLAFTAKDGLEVAPHDDDPLVIQVQILNCDVKRVLIDSGSSADIMYWEAFKAMQLAEEQLQPYSGTLVGFSGEQVDRKREIRKKTSRNSRRHKHDRERRYGSKGGIPRSKGKPYRRPGAGSNWRLPSPDN